MNMLKPLQRFPITFAALALLASPLGCNSETPPAPVAESATPAPAVAPSTVAADPSPSLDQGSPKVDQEVYRTAGSVKEGVVDLKGEAEKAARDAGEDVKKGVEGAEKKAEKDAKAIEDQARKSAEGALDKLLGDPK